MMAADAAYVSLIRVDMMETYVFIVVFWDSKNCSTDLTCEQSYSAHFGLTEYVASFLCTVLCYSDTRPVSDRIMNG